MSGGRVCFNVAPRGFDTDDTLGGESKQRKATRKALFEWQGWRRACRLTGAEWRRYLALQCDEEGIKL